MREVESETIGLGGVIDMPEEPGTYDPITGEPYGKKGITGPCPKCDEETLMQNHTPFWKGIYCRECDYERRLR